MLKLFLKSLPILLLVSNSMLSQQPVVISGTVKDPTGLPVPNARVQANVQSRTIAECTTTASGEFQLQVVRSGSVSLRATASGFNDATRILQFSTDPIDGIAIILTPGSLAQSVTVTGQADSYTVETENTATRMGITLMNLPQSVSIVNRSVIADQAAVTVAEALRNVGGVRQTGTYFGAYDVLNLRGFTQSQTNTYFRNGARFAMLTPLNAASLEQIEVMKGPASIMFGQITPGGAVNLVTKRPLENHRAEVMFRRGSFNSTDGIVDFTGPLSRKHGLFYRANFYGRRADSFRDQVNNDQWLLNPSLTWRARPETTLRLDAEFDRGFTLVDLGLAATDGRTFATVERLPISRFLGDPSAQHRSYRRFYAAELDHALTKNWRVRGFYNYAYMHRDVKQIAATSVATDQRTLNRRTNAFLQHWQNTLIQGDLIGNFNTGQARHTLMVGADSILSRLNGSQNSLSTAAPIDLFNPVYGLPANFVYGRNVPSRNQQVGYYLQDQISFKNGLQFLIGARYNGVQDFQAGTKDRDISPRLGVVYRPQSWISLYGSFSQSFEAVNGFDFRNARFLPSLGRQTEFGVKNRWFGDKLTTTAAWFRLRRSNVLTPDPNNVGFSIQTGLQQSQGMEFEAHGAIRKNWRIIGAYTYLDTTILRDNVIPIGNSFAAAPRHSGSIWSTHSFQGPLRRLGAGWGVFHTGSVFGNVQNLYRVPGYTTVDAQLSYQLFERTRLQFNTKNLFNERFYIAGSNLLGIFPGAPRSFAVSINATF
jgi:iron complex outermembrane receptor protein